MTETSASTRMNAPDRKANRLILEKSPYLLQHAYNPVDWYPWGDEAFEKAKREDKPIFLSIGYSTCHWCHVMERESFENDSVAALLNQYFVPIKVDREERPDVDRIYMTAMQAMGMGGGWPLNAFLTPDLEPFFGGTYFPPDSKMGRPGMLQLLPRVHEAWGENRDRLVATGEAVLQTLASFGPADTGDVARRPLLDTAFVALQRVYDAERGGFGRAPKFPSVSNLNFLFRYAGDPAARDMALRQLDAMTAGGIHDQLGGGFHRYSTDAEWLVPHFEKMLYDQAQIAWALIDAWRLTHRPEYEATARGLFDYVARDLTSKEGAFYSAEDADSEGEEGKFYVWTPAELEAVLGADDARLFAHRYGVTTAGNFDHGTSILHEAHTLEETARTFALAHDDAAARLARAKETLLAVRARRPRPHLDDKVLAAWNGLMISAYARGAGAFGDPALAERATRAAEFVWSHLWNEKRGEMKRRWRDGEAASDGQLDDYAYVALGLVDLYGATFEPRWLERAAQVTQAMLDRFWDETDAGFFESPAGDPHVKVRMKGDFDGAELSGNSIAAYDLLTLAALLDRDDWRERARRMLDHYARRLRGGPTAMPQMLVAMDLEAATPRHVVIAGDPTAPDTRALLAEFERRFLPHDAALVVSEGRRKALASLTPFAASLAPRDGRATAYVCIDYACRLPVTEPAAFAAQLDEAPGGLVQEETR